MTETLTLHGYSYSVYTRIVRIVLEIKGLAFESIEINPFEKLDPSFLALHPFGRVPVLSHGAFKIFETAAICRYIDNAFHRPALTPKTPKAAARMDQVIAIVDSYAYWPMVRQVFSHGVFRPVLGVEASAEEISAGLAASKNPLKVLEEICVEGLVLSGKPLTLADCHLAPMIDCFIRSADGLAVLQTHPSLWQWWKDISEMPFMKHTDPKLCDLKL